MEFTFSQAEGRVPVDIIHLDGDLDASSYKDLIAAAQRLYDEGARSLLLDMANLAFMSSAGLAALHIVTRMFHGDTAPDPEDGWNTFRTMDRERSAGPQNNVKLLKPSDEILNILDVVGFNQIYEIFDNLEAAVDAF